VPDWIASQLAHWFLEEALKASDARQFALCNDFIAALHRLQDASSFKSSDLTLWEYLWEKNETCCKEACQKAQDDQSSISLRLFVALQRVGRDNESVEDGNESAEDGWKKINELLKQCTSRQILDATSSIACAASRSSELVLPPRVGLSVVMTCLDLIRQPQRLTKLAVDLDSEKIGFSGAQALGEQLGKLQKITTLELYLMDNNLGLEGARGVGEQLPKLQKITTLWLGLSSNDLGPEGAKVLGESLDKLQQLTNLDLDLERNNLGSEDARALAVHLSQLVHLTEVKLFLGFNDINREVRDEIEQRLERPGRRVVVI